MGSPVFVVGDVHGHRDVLVEILHTAGLLGADESWAGADARLWLLGDLVDRGPDGVGAIDLVRRIQTESAGAVGCLLGNHEAQLLAVRRFARAETSVPDESFYALWRLNGGVEEDLRRLTDDHVRWITGLPPIAREGEWLIVHSDTHAYLELGDSVDAVGGATSAALRHGSAEELDVLLGLLADRMRLVDPAAVDALLDAYGGTRIVHGHTPIASVIGVDPRSVTEPLVYSDGRVVNADHCLFAGGPGFAVRLDGGSGPEA